MAMVARLAEDNTAVADAMAVLAALLVGAAGLVLSISTGHGGMAFHGLLFLAGGALAGSFVLTKSFAKADWHAALTPYLDGPIRVATLAAVFWGIAGFIVGDVLAWQLAFPGLNLDLPW